MTASPGMAPLPCSHSWLTVLVLFAWDALGGCPQRHAALPSYDFDWSRTGLSSAMSLGNLDSLFVHPRVFLPPRHGPWALYEMGRGC